MGTCHVEAHRDLREKLSRPPYADQVRILREEPFDTETYLLLLASPLLGLGYHGCKELVIDGDQVRLKRAEET